MAALPVYYELSWSILSTIGMISCLIALLVSGIVHMTTISLIPVVVSAACAIANGLCFFAFYTDNPMEPRAVAAGFADIFWFIQEAGMSMYSYQILRKVLQRRQRTIFLCLFWIGIAIIFASRLAILVSRITEIKNPEALLQVRINRLHMVYFIMIALVETLSAGFLLRTFAQAKQTGIAVRSLTAKSLFEMLSRSAEIRLATLCPIGITRAITYSFQATSQSATNTASQLDRFVYTLECLYPMIMIVDLLASKLTYSRAAASTHSDRSNAMAGSAQTGIKVDFTVKTQSSKRDRDIQLRSMKDVHFSSQEVTSDEEIPVASHGAEVGHSASCHV